MHRFCLPSRLIVVAILSVLLASSARPVVAQERPSPEGIERAQAAIAELASSRRQLTERLEQAEKSGDEQRAAELRQQIEETDARFKQIEARVRNANQRRSDEQREGEDQEIAAARKQVEHLRAAQEHLVAGGFDELAQLVGQRAERIRQAIANNDEQRRRESEREPRAGQPNDAALKEFSAAIRQLREDVHQLREEVSELRQRRERRDAPELER